MAALDRMCTPLDESVLSGATAGADAHSMRVIRDYVMRTAEPFPAELTPPLRRVLGMMLWETAPIAHAMRATGRDIARRAEDEQAIVLHWLIGFVLEHGADWHKHAAVALRQMTDQMTDKQG